MSMIARRLQKLEESLGTGAGRLLVVFSQGATDKAVRAAFAEQGVIVGKADQLVHFQTIYEDRDGNPIPSDQPPVVTPPMPIGGNGFSRR